MPSGKPGKAAAAPKGRAKKPAASAILWDWPLSRDKALQAMLTGIRADSSTLFDGAHEQSRMVDVCVHAVRGVGRKGGNVEPGGILHGGLAGESQSVRVQSHSCRMRSYDQSEEDEGP